MKPIHRPPFTLSLLVLPLFSACATTGAEALTPEQSQQVRVDLRAIDAALAAFVVRNNGYPEDLEVLVIQDGRPLTLESAGERENIDRVTLGNPEMQIAVRLGTAGGVWYYPLHSVHRAEGTLVSELQALSLVFWWPVTLAPGERRRYTVSVAVT